MTFLPEFAELSIQQQLPTGRFPAVFSGDRSTDKQDAFDWVVLNKPIILKQLAKDGAILFRDFPLVTARDFDAFIAALDLPLFTYEESLSNAVRITVTERVFTANEAPASVSIYMHHEMAQTPVFPSKLFFFCEKAAEKAGETPLCRSDTLLQEIDQKLPEFADKCRTHGVKYTNYMPSEDDAASGQGRSWRSTLDVGTREEAEAKLTRLGYRWVWHADGTLEVQTAALDAVKTLPDGTEVFFNQLIAAYLGWKNGAKAIHFGDDSPLAEGDMKLVCALADTLTFDVPWQAGDLVLVDNFRVMHGRRPFEGTRRILASLAEKATTA